MCKTLKKKLLSRFYLLEKYIFQHFVFLKIGLVDLYIENIILAIHEFKILVVDICILILDDHNVYVNNRGETILVIYNNLLQVFKTISVSIIYLYNI